ncbi:hypothetical protein GCM10010339_66370 [Streptomyces alanosinicus]|uniref:Uncharacterized protein n=2 Tax=Streptomyces alanosinicus TaxID=68171 RepID=A0A918YN45_9ACTN|nr:hypothetical protein GCM10010339_66370 [Streptomyces alanosinicus]
MTKIIERNTTIPTKRSELFTTDSSNQGTMFLHIVEGESERASQNRSLAVLELTDLPPRWDSFRSLLPRIPDPADGSDST